MRFEGPPVPATFRERHNRSLGEVEIEGVRALCFIPNPGRMEELLRGGSKVYLLERISEHRRTRYDLALVDLAGTLVSVDSRVPNRVVAEAIGRQWIPELRGLRIEKREPVFEGSRLDFRLAGDAASMLLEVKSCTLVEDGAALFPDAPTDRGRRQLHALIGALESMRAAVLFLIQRSDAIAFRPNGRTDPRFEEVLKEAAEHGVEVYAYSSEVTFRGVSIYKRVPVEFPR
ncbi:hypothetical protein AC482_00560 [miscellaneous Crenarchaeota group-15 archaeon DG-45]|uniref:Sugar fermentation stimulation protein homolog n=1 Tax=miscellaneous Crenarchaeota group-15 archaeon DG-45 TaxID=1685127 RepID=A0A0M0BT47_9ARCH|nr:MAG: hypothetical protein AC482_00560 [miscellaneous Crenarchaeota group-15 archaeon DG-45]